MPVSDVAQHFFKGAMAIWVGAPDFRNYSVRLSLEDWFEIALRNRLPLLALEPGSDVYMGKMRQKIDEAHVNYACGRLEAGRKCMLELMALIRIHLQMPSRSDDPPPPEPIRLPSGLTLQPFDDPYWEENAVLGKWRAQ